MKYPLIIETLQDELGFQVSIPDLPGCQAKVSSIDEAFSESKQIIKSHLSILAEYGEGIPRASSIEKHRALWLDKNKMYDGAEKRLNNIIWAITEFDITPYLGKSHKINVTLPELLINKIDDRVSKSIAYKTRSGFIAAACLEELAKKSIGDC